MAAYKEIQLAVEEILLHLESMAESRYQEGMERFGIRYNRALGIRIPKLRAYAKELGKQHELALELWKTDLHEAKLVAIFLADPKKITLTEIEAWVKDFDSWDICDQACGNVFDKTPWAYDLAETWTKRKPEFEKRAGFTMIACLAIHDKKAEDERFIAFLPILEREAYDDRNFVKKAVNWALRQIGKRNDALKEHAMVCAESILKQGSTSAKWIARDALRELA